MCRFGAPDFNTDDITHLNKWLFMLPVNNQGTDGFLSVEIISPCIRTNQALRLLPYFVETLMYHIHQMDSVTSDGLAGFCWAPVLARGTLLLRVPE